MLRDAAFVDVDATARRSGRDSPTLVALPGQFDASSGGQAFAATGLPGYAPPAQDETAARQIIRQLSSPGLQLHDWPSSTDSSGALRVMKLKLNPERLGAVEVLMSRQEGGLAIRIRAESREAAESLRQDASILRECIDRIADAGAVIEIEHAGAAEAPAADETAGEMRGSGQGGFGRQTPDHSYSPEQTSASRKAASSLQDNGVPIPERGHRHGGRPDVFYL